MSEADSSFTSVITPVGTCDHVRLLNGPSPMLVNYQKALQWSDSTTLNGHHRAKRRKMQAPACGTCKTSLHRPMMCLECRFIGCWTKGHIQAHVAQTGHALAVDLVTGTVFCGKCNDFQSFSYADTREESSASLFKSELKRKKEPFKPWHPSLVEETALQSSSKLPCEARRGFLNLGATCYMSVILQCLLHNPLMKNYFLSDKHNSQLCGKPACMCCELDQLFRDVFSSPSTTPPPEAPAGTGPALGPMSLLKAIWEGSRDIAGGQQDSHEFFISLLNQLHLGSGEAKDGAACACVVHQVFAGHLQSEVRCGKCGHVNPTVDPMLDISLELKGLQAASGKVPTLASCLRRFTEQEKLQPKAYVCSKCQSPAAEATKQLSIRKLPPVLCVQLKRFEHKSADKTSASKIDTQVKFPAVINMAPFTTAAIGMETRRGNALPVARQDYELFAVIHHDGQLDTGHYINFARSQNEWYRFDDDKVTHATLKETLNCVPYMCFYVKQNLEYGHASAAPAPSSAPATISVKTSALFKPVPTLQSDIADDASSTATSTSEK